MSTHKKIVLMPVEVPKGDYCWSFVEPYTVCTHFNNEFRAPTCDIGMRLPKPDDDPLGYRKPTECKNLPILQDFTLGD